MLSRCKNCNTKTYCGQECADKDLEEKHAKFCEEADPTEMLRDLERKFKGGRESREESGMKKLEQAFQAQLNLAASSGQSEYEKELVRAKNLCKK